MENKEFLSEEELSNQKDISSEKELSSDNLDLSDLEEVAGGKLEESKKTGNGCDVCLGMCGGSDSLEQGIR